MPDIPAAATKDNTLRTIASQLSQGVANMLIKDPVCGRRLQRGRAHIVIEYAGVNYFLCCPRCQTEFEHNLKLYARLELGEKAKKLKKVSHHRYT